MNIYVDASPGEPNLIAIVTWKGILVSTYNGDFTNNELEYLAVLKAVKKIPERRKATIYSDSELVVKQLNGEYRCKKKSLQKIRLKILKYIDDKFLELTFKWISREENLAGKILQKKLRNSIL